MTLMQGYSKWSWGEHIEWFQFTALHFFRDCFKYDKPADGIQTSYASSVEPQIFRIPISPCAQAALRGGYIYILEDSIMIVLPIIEQSYFDGVLYPRLKSLQLILIVKACVLQRKTAWTVWVQTHNLVCCSTFFVLLFKGPS